MNCPNCKNKLEAHECIVEPRQPKPGDFTICAYCGTMFIFDYSLQFIVCTKQMELTIRLKYPEVMQIMDRIRFAIQEKISTN